ncbi:MAG: DUF4982 domain-containing protein, partial [bacterium]|nr:DUF4982 domain-containing protein [bacterium]
HLFPHWNWKKNERRPIPVWCHTNCDQVELFLDGRSLGRKTVEPYGHVEWKVRFRPGTLTARGYIKGKEVKVVSVETTGAPAAVKLEVDRTSLRANNNDAVVVTASVVDAEGRHVATADNLVTFSAGRNGRVIGVGNGDPSSHEPDKASRRKLFSGLCQAIVQATDKPGNITIKAAAAGLRPAEIKVTAR